MKHPEDEATSSKNPSEKSVFGKRLRDKATTSKRVEDLRNEEGGTENEQSHPEVASSAKISKHKMTHRSSSFVFKPKRRIDIPEDVVRMLSPRKTESPPMERKASIRGPGVKKLTKRCSSCEVRIGSRHVPRCPKFLGPILHEKHPLPDNPTCCQRFIHSFYCPPRNKAANFCVVLLFAVLIWGMLFGFIKEKAYPGNIAFFLVLLEFFGLLAGFLAQLISLPPLFGMLIVGMLLGNLLIDKRGNLEDRTFWYPLFRDVALSIILTRAGLGLNPTALKRLSFVVFRLAFTPCLVECLTIAIASYFLLGLPWLWGFLLGFALAAVSPAVVVPGMITLQRNNMCVKKGLPTLVIASASIDDVLAIGGFGIVLSFTFAHDNLSCTILQGPVEVIVGLLFGVVLGLILWFIPDPQGTHVSTLRVIFLFFGGMFALLVAPRIDLSGAGALACIILAFVAGYSWREDITASGLAHISLHYTRLWRVFEPLMFGIVGSEIIFREIDYSYIVKGLCTLGIGLLARMCAAFLAVYGCGFNFKERMFIALAWIPKATVQAAIGPYVLDYLNSDKADEKFKTQENFYRAKMISNLTAIAILLTAPVGAGFIAVLPKLLLRKDPVLEDTVEEVTIRPMMRTESESHMFKEFLLKAEPHHASISKLITESSKSSVVSSASQPDAKRDKKS